MTTVVVLIKGGTPGYESDHRVLDVEWYSGIGDWVMNTQGTERIVRIIAERDPVCPYLVGADQSVIEAVTKPEGLVKNKDQGLTACSIVIGCGTGDNRYGGKFIVTVNKW